MRFTKVARPLVEVIDYLFRVRENKRERCKAIWGDAIVRNVYEKEPA